jgi:competence transcription factor ComK
MGNLNCPKIQAAIKKNYTGQALTVWINHQHTNNIKASNNNKQRLSFFDTDKFRCPRKMKIGFS